MPLDPNDIDVPNDLTEQPASPVDTPNDLTEESAVSPGIPNDLTEIAPTSPGIPTDLTEIAPVSPGAPNDLTEQAPASPGVPNDLTEESAVSISVPTNLTEESAVPPAIPNDLTEASPVDIAVPTNLTEQAPVSPGIPNDLTEEAAVDVAIPNDLTELSPSAVDVPTGLNEEAAVSPAIPNDLTEQSSVDLDVPTDLTEIAPVSPAIPNNLTEQAAVSPAIPNDLTEEAAVAPAIPNDLTELSSNDVAVPNDLNEEAAVAPAIPNDLTEQSPADIAVPNVLTNIAAQEVPTTLTKYLNLDFTRQHYAVCGIAKTFDSIFNYSRNSSATFMNRRVNCGRLEYFMDVDFSGSVDNLLTYSENFQSSDWGKGSCFILTNRGRSPDSSYNADLLIEDISASSFHFMFQNFTYNASIYTFSVYAKAKERSQIQIVIRDSSGFRSYGFDLTIGKIIDGEFTPATDSKIEPVGDDWFRCSITEETLVGAGSVSIELGVDGSFVYDGDGSSGLYIWGAQLTETSKVQPYVKTISTARSGSFSESLRTSFNPVTGENRGALIENSSTNVLLKSENFAHVTWDKINSTIDTDDLRALDETKSADKLVEDSNNSTHYVGVDKVVTNGLTLTLSIFAKARERNILDILDDFTLATASFDLSDGSIVSSLFCVAKIEEFFDGWYRCSITMIGGTNIRIRYLLNDGVSNSYLGDGSSGLYIWGAQLEQANYPTSYIYTDDVPVSRLADNLDISVFDAIENVDYCSWHADIDLTYKIGLLNNPRYLFLNTGVGSDISMIVDGNITQSFGSFNAEVATISEYSEKMTYTGVVENALMKSFIDREFRHQNTTGTRFEYSDSRMQIGGSGLAFEYLNGYIKTLNFYNISLTDEQVDNL